jgi:phosphate transport system permease protein
MAKTEVSEMIPARFRTAKATLFFDRFMNFFIKFGGLGVIAAVFAIFIFIFSQVLPLLQSARVNEQASLQLPPADYVLIGADEWGEKPFAVERSGKVTFFELSKPPAPLIKISFEPPADIEFPVTASFYDAQKQKLLMGFENGMFMIFDVLFEPRYQAGLRTIVPDLKPSTSLIDPDAGGEASKGAVKALSFGQSADVQLVGLIRNAGTNDRVQVVRMARESTLYSEGQMEVNHVYDLSSQIQGRPGKILVNSSADGVLIANDRGEIYYFGIGEEKAALRQTFKPFAGREDPEVSSLNYLNGGVSVVVTSREGINRIFSLLIPKGSTKRIFEKTKEFKPLGGPAAFFSPSLRNRAFLLGHDSLVSIRYGTTATIRWEKEMPFWIRHAFLGPRYDRFFLLDKESKLHIYQLNDPHPESGWKAFFGKVWYDGYAEPGYTWQSSGATDDFEPKLSVIPLIFGTLKGTFYALIFSLPIALLAALYTSQFALPRYKVFIKPTMEIMASLPSVVLGFLGALWLAPIIDTKVPSLLLAALFLPCAAFFCGWFWTGLPLKYRKWIAPGTEWMAIMPVLFGAAYLGWSLGPWLESWLFIVKDPQTGASVADFRLWWPEVTGTPFNQRNSLVVGFMMGFAVIPIIFTIAEDALSNVPKTLISGSLALGASRWQTALRVIVPTAFAGIFSAVMIGLGRAVGETMIVVMATGNTPIMDLNIFSGMRTLSANIAVELPEAPYLSTLYRTLFLGALLLFMMTFVINTVAELVRQRFRAKYRTV